MLHVFSTSTEDYEESHHVLRYAALATAIALAPVPAPGPAAASLLPGAEAGGAARWGWQLGLWLR